MATQRVILGECVEVMGAMEPAQFDCVVTDPPYNLSDGRGTKGFMGRAWDGKGSPAEFQAWTEEWARAALRVTRPGGILMAFGSPRTAHRMICGIEDAGWFVFDKVMHLHGQGFPKHGSLLKPAYEEIVVAKKPGPGGLRTEAGRLPASVDDPNKRGPSVPFDDPGGVGYSGGLGGRPGLNLSPLGRWPANVALSHRPECVETGVRRVKSGNPGNKVLVGDDTTPHVYEGGYSRRSAVGHADPDGHETVPAFDCHPECPVRLLDEQGGERTSGVPSGTRNATTGFSSGITPGARLLIGYGDTGGASRFFYCAKADRAERILPDGSRCSHPTQKPINLMVWLVRLACPPGGTLLDPFLGSGTTLVAADRVGVDGVGIEREPSYAREAEARVRGAAPLFADVVLEEVP